MPSFPPALAHNAIKEILPDLFFVSGAMETVLMDLDWQFSRNMTIVRDGDRLILINTVRLGEDGLAELDRLGKVTDVIRLGALHGRDDAFYVDRYEAQYWVMPGLEPENQSGPERKVNVLGEALPLSDASVFQFQTTNIPEGVLHLHRDGGVLVACDALQNWLEPDEHFCDTSRQRMEQMGFFTPANIGPVWLQAAEPAAEDFNRLKTLNFRHVLCGHGQPLLNSAKEDFSATFSRLFHC